MVSTRESILTRDELATVVANEQVGAAGQLMVLQLPPDSSAYDPGRFLMLACGQPLFGQPLLRRPFSVVDELAPGDGERHLELLYEVVGRGTALMGAARAGDRLRVLGPLGKPFTIPPHERPGDCVLVGGGVGVAPFPLLARRLIEAGRHVTLLLGARDKGHLYLIERLVELGVEVRIITDAGDGPGGKRGLVTEILKAYLDEKRHKDGPSREIAQIYGCGPEPMLMAMARVLRGLDIETEVSLERRMGCGWGVCWTCVCLQRDEPDGPCVPRRTCVDGPVVSLNRLPEDRW